MWQDLRFEYDPFGSLATKLRGANQTQRFTYDGQDRLITVRTQDARGVVETRFEYDSLGRRLVKTDTSFDVRGMKQRTETKRFVWEGLRLAQEIRETGVSSYGYTPKEGTQFSPEKWKVDWTDSRADCECSQC
ncbi:RHS-family protein [Burkholderia aenigmatica]|nr:RHS-family protein [Burkholderia aenigmatica]